MLYYKELDLPSSVPTGTRSSSSFPLENFIVITLLLRPLRFVRLLQFQDAGVRSVARQPEQLQLVHRPDFLSDTCQQLAAEAQHPARAADEGGELCFSGQVDFGAVCPESEHQPADAEHQDTARPQF